MQQAVGIIASSGNASASNKQLRADIEMGYKLADVRQGEIAVPAQNHRTQIAAAIIGGEIEKAVAGGQLVGRGAIGAGIDVRDQQRARGRAIAAPQFQAGIGRRERKIKKPARSYSRGGWRGIGSRRDVFEQEGTVGRAI